MVIDMVEKEESTVIVDEQGRMVLPSQIREKLGVKKGGRLSIKLEDSQRIVIERRASDDLEQRVRNWAKISLNARVQAIARRKPTSSKWLGSEYAKRKLGL